MLSFINFSPLPNDFSLGLYRFGEVSVYLVTYSSLLKAHSGSNLYVRKKNKFTSCLISPPSFLVQNNTLKEIDKHK